MKKRRADHDDAPELGDAFFARAKRIEDGPAALSAAIRAEFKSRRGRGKQKTPTKLLISLRLSRGTVEAYRRTGPGWQARIDEDLASTAKRLKANAGNTAAAHAPTTGDLMKTLRRRQEQIASGRHRKTLAAAAARKARSA